MPSRNRASLFDPFSYDFTLPFGITPLKLKPILSPCMPQTITNSTPHPLVVDLHVLLQVMPVAEHSTTDRRRVHPTPAYIRAVERRYTYIVGLQMQLQTVLAIRVVPAGAPEEMLVFLVFKGGDQMPGGSDEAWLRRLVGIAVAEEDVDDGSCIWES